MSGGVLRSSRARAVAIFAVASVAVIAALALLTHSVLEQHRQRELATADAHFHEDLRTALWRMETRFATMLATSSRGVDGAAWIDPNSNSTYPLTTTSMSPAILAAADRAFEEAIDLQDRVLSARTQDDAIADSRGISRSNREFQNRAGANQMLQVQLSNAEPYGELPSRIGPLAAEWALTDEGLDLWLARRIEAPEGVRHESYRIQWDALRAALEGEVRDLFPQAELEPILDAESEADGAVRMAALPARLAVERSREVQGPGRALLWTLGGAWCALALAILFGAIALRASFAYGDKHRRFTHAVTHELRTPLTTFRMYSEMLARGMVEGDAQREYLGVLEAESARLAGLVDNVLRYARLEEGGVPPTKERCASHALVERVLPELSRICARAGCTLEVREGAEAVVETDPSAVSQILVNLVENACKYGRGPDGDAIVVRLEVNADEDALTLDVIDEGPGVPRVARARVFEAFDRAGRDSSDAAPGVGLGLGLCRGLARQLGGDVVLVPSERGARFRLTLPRLQT